MEYSVDLTISEHGYDEENASPLLEAMEAVAPDVDAVLGLDLIGGQLSAALVLEARDADDALARARAVLEAALARAGLPMTRVLGIDVSAIDVASPAA